MAMNWDDANKVSALFEHRREWLQRLDQVSRGHGECSIQGRYLRGTLSDAHKGLLDALLTEHVAQQIRLIDAELAELGVTVEDKPSDD